MRRPILALVLLALPAQARERGETCWVGGQWFQWLGPDEAGRDRWLYPHLDGVPELFLAPRSGEWVGTLGSRFDPQRERFERRWNAAEALNELLAQDTVAERRAQAARLLSLWGSLHPAPRTPLYLREAKGEVERALDAEGVAWVASARELHRAWVAGLPEAGTRVLPRPKELVSAADHHQALVQDGYLDVAIVGGNSLDPETGKRHTWALATALADELARAGWTSARFRDAEPAALRERTVELLGKKVRVRVHIAGGSSRPERVRRAVASFVEGLAFADVVVYVGHSNKDAGHYWLSEDKAPWTRFRLGGAGEDLEEKCHLVGLRAHQVVALQSCSSFPKYCQPLHRAYASRTGEPSVPGFLGTTDVAWFDEFVPRTKALLDGLLAGQGARTLALGLVRAVTREDAAPIALRGTFQPRRTFVVPPGTAIERVEELGAEDAYLVLGLDGQGRRWCSTEVVPQDFPGQVVQVVPWRKGLVALGTDGGLMRVGPETEGAAVPARNARELELRWIARLDKDGRDVLGLLDATGRLHLVSGDPARLETLAARRLPATPLVAVGRDAKGRLVGIDARGRGHAWSSAARSWEPLEGAQPELVDAAPSLLSTVAPAELRLGVGERGRPLPVAPAWEPRRRDAAAEAAAGAGR